MYLKDAPFYPALCWAIKKYAKNHVPYPYTVIKDYNKTSKHDVNSMCYWAGTEDGDTYWRSIHISFMKRNKTDFSYSYTFEDIMDDYKKNGNIQLEFNFEGDN